MLRRVCSKGWGIDFQAVSSRSKSQLLDAVANPIVNFEDFAPSEPVTKEGQTEYPYRLLCNLTLRSAQEMDCTECVGMSTKRLAGQSPAFALI